VSSSLPASEGSPARPSAAEEKQSRYLRGCSEESVEDEIERTLMMGMSNLAITKKNLIG
jgi:hypothetical protein